jgi:hypothetical protein
MAYILVFLVIAIGVRLAMVKRRHARLQDSCLAAITRIYAGSDPLPSFTLRYQYGYPAFEIKFRTREQCEQAARLGLNASFTDTVETLCKGLGTSRRPFDAQRAIFFSYIGYVEDFLTNAAMRK